LAEHLLGWRVVRDAFERAARRPGGQLTLVHKTNVLVHAGQLWSRVVEEVSMEHPDDPSSTCPSMPR
jgi:3-isopropylmalate dehydrogenase